MDIKNYNRENSAKDAFSLWEHENSELVKSLNEKIDLRIHESGCYQDYPDHFYDHDYVEQMTRFL